MSMAANRLVANCSSSHESLIDFPVSCRGADQTIATISSTAWQPTSQVTTALIASQKRARLRRSAIAMQYIRFCVVGLSNALVDLGILNLLLLAHPTRNPLVLLLDNTLAVSLAILNSWLWNTRWTFRAQVTHRPRQRVLFAGQAALNVVTNNLILLGVTGMIPPSAGLSTLVASNLAKLGAMLAASTMSFLLLRTTVFRPSHPHHGKDL